MNTEDNINTISPKKKIVFPKYTIIALILSVVCLTTYGIANILDKRDIQMYLLGVGTDAIISFCIIMFSILFITAVSVLFYKNSKHKILTVVLTLFVLCYYYPIWYMLSLDWFGTYDAFTSPDKEHTVVIYHESNLNFHDDFYSGEIYEKTSFCTMKKVGWLSRPRSCDDHYFVWNEEDFEIHFECETEHKHETITIAYIK